MQRSNRRTGQTPGRKGSTTFFVSFVMGYAHDLYSFFISATLLHSTVHTAFAMVGTVSCMVCMAGWNGLLTAKMQPTTLQRGWRFSGVDTQIILRRRWPGFFGSLLEFGQNLNKKSTSLV